MIRDQCRSMHKYSRRVNSQHVGKRQNKSLKSLISYSSTYVRSMSRCWSCSRPAIFCLFDATYTYRPTKKIAGRAQGQPSLRILHECTRNKIGKTKIKLICM